MTADQSSAKTSRLKKVAQEVVVAPALLGLLIGGATAIAIPANAQSTSETGSFHPQNFSASDPDPNFTGMGRNGLFAWAPGGEGVPKLVSLRGGTCMYIGFVKQGSGKATSYIASRSAGPKENIIYAYDGTTLTQVESTPRNIIRPRWLRDPLLFGWNSTNETQAASNNPGNTSPSETPRGVLSPSISAAGRPAVASADGSIPGALSMLGKTAKVSFTDEAGKTHTLDAVRPDVNDARGVHFTDEIWSQLNRQQGEGMWVTRDNVDSTKLRLVVKQGATVAVYPEMTEDQLRGNLQAKAGVVLLSVPSQAAQR
jgi:hypothetical protein